MDEQVANIDEIVDSVNKVTRVSTKTGKTYSMVQIKLANGYEIEQFVDKAVMFMIDTLVKDQKK